MNRIVEVAPVRQAVQPLVHHLGVEVARRAGRDRLGDDPGRAQPPRIVVGRQIAGQDADLRRAGASARAVASSTAVLPAPGDPIRLITADMVIAEVLAIVPRGALVVRPEFVR